MARSYKTALCVLCLFGASTSGIQSSLAAQQPIDRAAIVDITVVDIVPEISQELERAARDQTSLKRLIDQGKARLVTTLQFRARSASQAGARVGHRVPVNTGPTTQYENVGLNIDVTPRVYSDYIEVSFKLEMSASSGTQTPTFIQRSLNDVVRVTPGTPSVVFGLAHHQGLFPQPTDPAARPSNQFGTGSFAVILSARVAE